MPLNEGIQTYFEREVLPHIAETWIDMSKTKISDKIPLNRHFSQHERPRPLEVIKTGIETLKRGILELLTEVTTSYEVAQ